MCLSTLIYADDGISFLNLMFENDVKMYGTQAILTAAPYINPFENDVKMYGTQAIRNVTKSSVWFENDVKMYGTQA